MEWGKESESCFSFCADRSNDLDALRWEPLLCASCVLHSSHLFGLRAEEQAKPSLFSPR